MRIILVAWILACSALSSTAQEPSKKRLNGLPLTEEKLTAEAERAVKEMRGQLALGTEARAMLDSVVNEPALGPDSGWFAISKSQSRFEWSDVARRYDKNADNRVEVSEFVGEAQSDFSRADRDGDEVLDASDFDWNSPPPPSSEAVWRLFGMTDADSNGKVTREEFVKFFDRLKGKDEFLSSEDLLDALTGGAANSQPPEALNRSMMVMSLRHQELGAFNPGPELNQSAPDFTLPIVGGGTVTLSKAIRGRPVVLVFGTFTCRPFRGFAGDLEKLYRRYKDRADFYLVYVREAHPKDGWHMQVNEAKGISFAQPKSNTERVSIAQTCQQHLDISMPMLVDTIDDQAGSAYSGMPNRLYIIDGQGKIAFKNARGPFGFEPRQLEQALVLLLNAPQNPTQSRSP